MKAKINLITLWSEDIEAMKVFYTEILGFKIKTDLGDYLEFFNEGVRFSICKPSVMKDFHDDYKKEAYGQKLELAFECDSRQDLDQTYENFKRRGVACIQPPTDMPWQQRTALFADPQGNIHELFIEL